MAANTYVCDASDMGRLAERFDEIAKEKTPLDIKSFDVGRTIGKGRYARVRIATLSGSRKQIPTCIKILKKQKVHELEQLDHVVNEKDTLASVRHPFVIRMLATFQDDRHLYVVLELVNGGELFTNLRNEGSFKLPKARFYISEVVSAITYLHNTLIVYRDIKPENILIDWSGHLKLTDFGFAKYTKGQQCYTFCGTTAYMAPEMVTRKGHYLPVDWWSVGILFFEMLAARPPFSAPNDEDIFRLIIMGDVQYGPAFHDDAKDFISRCLIQEPKVRLGSPDAVNGLTPLNHKLFRGIKWNELTKGKIAPPWVPKLEKDFWDTAFFDEFAESDDEAEENAQAAQYEHQNFENWEVAKGFGEEGSMLAATLLTARDAQKKAAKEAKEREAEELREIQRREDDLKRQKEEAAKKAEEEKVRRAKEIVAKKAQANQKQQCCVVC